MQTKLKAQGDFLMAPWEEAMQAQGLTISQLTATGPAREAVQEQEMAIKRSLANMTCNGGKGDGVSAVVNGTLVTAAWTLEASVAKRHVEEREAALGKPVGKMSMLELDEGLGSRAEGWGIPRGRLAAEVGRLANQARDRLDAG